MAITKWEYFREHSEAAMLPDRLSALGKDGWQLCDREPMGTSYYYTFKRPIMDSDSSNISIDEKRRLLQDFAKYCDKVYFEHFISDEIIEAFLSNN